MGVVAVDISFFHVVRECVSDYECSSRADAADCDELFYSELGRGRPAGGSRRDALRSLLLGES